MPTVRRPCVAGNPPAAPTPPSRVFRDKLTVEEADLGGEGHLAVGSIVLFERDQSPDVTAWRILQGLAVLVLMAAGVRYAQSDVELLALNLSMKGPAMEIVGAAIAKGGAS